MGSDFDKSRGYYAPAEPGPDTTAAWKCWNPLHVQNATHIKMIYDVNSYHFRTFLVQGGAGGKK